MSLLSHFMLKTYLLSLMLILGATQAFAHAYWIDERASQLAIILGEGGDDIRYDNDIVENITGINNALQPITITPAPTANNIYLNAPDDTNQITIHFKPRYFTKDKDGHWHNKPKNEVAHAKSSSMYISSTVTLFDTQKIPQNINHSSQLQIIALADPFSIKMGDTLPVQLIYDSKPLANAKITPDFINNPTHTVTTDKDGKANITINSTALTVIRALHEVTNSNPTQSDKIIYNTTLAFNQYNQKQRQGHAH